MQGRIRPPGPPGGPAPGGSNCVITSRTVDPYATFTIGPLRVGALRVTVRIRAYTFPDPVQVTITEPFSAAGTCQGGPEPHIRGFHVIGGVGILVDLASAPFGRFPKPVPVTIKVIEKVTAAPIAGAQVRLGVFRAATDKSGLAEIDMPKGVYDLNVWKVGYDAPTKTVELNDNVSVEVEVVSLPEENPDAAWLM